MTEAADDAAAGAGMGGRAGEPSAGQMLKAARERQNLHIAVLAAAIKVSPRKLDALENDRHHELPDATFVRALAQTVCRALKIDPQPVLARLPQIRDAALPTAEHGLNAPFRERPGRHEPGAARPQRPLLWAGAALLVAAAVVAFFPLTWPGGAAAPSAAASLPASAATPAPVAAAASAATSAVAVEPAASALPFASAAPAGLAPPAPMAETIHSAPPALVAAESPSPQLTANESSWVEAVDAGGQTLVSRVILPGETVRLQGALPIRLKVGNARATQLVFRGQAVDLVPVTRDNVARLELK